MAIRYHVRELTNEIDEDVHQDQPPRIKSQPRKSAWKSLYVTMSNSLTIGWHDIGMEWKEHLAWFAPISLTAVAYLFSRYGTQLRSLRPLRHAVFGLVALAFASACIAGFFGAMLNKNAAVRGGAQIVIMRGERR